MDVRDMKNIIAQGDLNRLQSCLSEFEFDDAPSVFQILYLHACLKGKGDIATWFQNTVFPMLDPIQQIGLRQVFSYGRHLLKRSCRP